MTVVQFDEGTTEGFSHRPTTRHVLPAQVRSDLSALLDGGRAAMAAGSTPTAKKRRSKVLAPIVVAKAAPETKVKANRLRKPRPRTPSRPSSERAPSPPRPVPLPAPLPLPPLDFTKEPPFLAREAPIQPLLDYDWLARTSYVSAKHAWLAANFSQAALPRDSPC
jgi:hypothetical protein